MIYLGRLTCGDSIVCVNLMVVSIYRGISPDVTGLRHAMMDYILHRNGMVISYNFCMQDCSQDCSQVDDICSSTSIDRIQVLQAVIAHLIRLDLA